MGSRECDHCRIGDGFSSDTIRPRVMEVVLHSPAPIHRQLFTGNHVLHSSRVVGNCGDNCVHVNDGLVCKNTGAKNNENVDDEERCYSNEEDFLAKFVVSTGVLPCLACLVRHIRDVDASIKLLVLYFISNS